MSRRSGHETFTAILASLMSGTRTKAEISRHAGVCRQTVADVVDLLHDRQMIFIKEYSLVRGCVERLIPAYAWQPELGRYVDAQKPVEGGFRHKVVPVETRSA